MKIAAIDIGSNTILMIICEKLPNGEIKILCDVQAIARLGENIQHTGKISEAAIERAKKVLHDFKKICNELAVDKIIALATSAVREAENSAQVIDILNASFGQTNFNIDVISGEQEAEYSFVGAVFSDEETTVIDIGGGSTELIYGKNRQIIKKISIPIGVVKITEKLKLVQPVDNEQFKLTTEYIKKYLSRIDANDFRGNIVAVSGTPTALAAIAMNLLEYDAAKIHKYMFDEITFNRVKNKILNASFDDLTTKYGIENGRADVLSAGVILLDELLRFMNKNSFFVSIYGLRYGAIRINNI